MNYELYSRTKLCYGAQMALVCVILRPVFSESRVQRISNMYCKFALRPHHVYRSRPMVDIQSATAEIRRGKNKKEERWKPQDKNLMSASATQGGHKKL